MLTDNDIYKKDLNRYTHNEIEKITRQFLKIEIEPPIRKIIETDQYAEDLSEKEIILSKGKWLRTNSITLPDDYSIYEPIPDVAIGPCSVGGILRYKMNRIYGKMWENKKVNQFVNKLYRFSNYYKVYQPKVSTFGLCFMVFEIERNPTSKYIFGSMVNASICGTIGVFIYIDKIWNKVDKMHTYIQNYNRKQKTKLCANTIIISQPNYLRVINDMEKIWSKDKELKK